MRFPMYANSQCNPFVIWWIIMYYCLRLGVFGSDLVHVMFGPFLPHHNKWVACLYVSDWTFWEAQRWHNKTSFVCCFFFILQIFPVSVCVIFFDDYSFLFLFFVIFFIISVSDLFHANFCASLFSKLMDGSCYPWNCNESKLANGFFFAFPMRMLEEQKDKGTFVFR